MSDDTHHFRIGHFTCIAMCDYHSVHEAADFFDAFPTVPNDELERAFQALPYPPKGYPWSFTPLAVQTGDHWMLIDLGNSPEEDGGIGRLRQHLRAEGIAPEAVTTIIITHFDGDHVGTMLDVDGNVFYPNANYFMAKAEWDYRNDEDVMAKLAEEAADYAAFVSDRLRAVEGKITLTDGETEIMPGISMVPLPGHKPGHSGVRIESDGQSLLFVGDVAHTLMQATHPTWSSVYDVQPDQAAATRRKVFEQAARDKQLLLAFHFPFPGLGYVIPDRDGFKWKPLVE